jgi:hypothetical protein
MKPPLPRYIPSLKRLGLVPLKVPVETTILFEKTLKSFSDAEKFRFPPQEGLPFNKWPDLYKECYTTLEDIGRTCYWELLAELSELQRENKVSLDPMLDQTNLSFDSSFMNIFNYKYGFLRPHRDRCLVTIIYRQFRETPLGTDVMRAKDTTQPASKILWSHDVNFSPTEDTSNWMNVDNVLCAEENQVCMFIGEEMSALCGHYLPANEHCVTENPALAYSAVSNHSNASDRMSIALILSSPTVSSYMEKKMDTLSS